MNVTKEYTRKDLEKFESYETEISQFSRFVLGRFFRYRKLTGKKVKASSKGYYTLVNPLKLVKCPSGNSRCFLILYKSETTDGGYFITEHYLPSEFVFDTKEFEKEYLVSKRIVEDNKTLG